MTSDCKQLSFITDIYEFLNIIKDCQKIKLTVDQIFDSTIFDELYAVTFVSSPSFFFETTKGFKQVRLILGIEDNEKLEPFGSCLKKCIDAGEQLNFWKSLNEETREKIRKGNITIRFPQPDYPIHSKFYLLTGPNKNRVVIGSANFTKTAFQNKNQFEELLIYDDSPLFDQYLERFQELENVTIDYIPDRVKKYKSEVSILLSDPEILKDITLDNINKLGSIAISEEQMREIKNRGNIIKSEQEREKVFCKVIEVASKKEKKDKNYNLCVPTSSKAKIANSVKVIVTETRKGSTEHDNRMGLYYNDSNNQLIYQNEQESKLLVPFSKQATIESIRRNLMAINCFVESYKKYTLQQDYKASTRVFEIILYSFMSPFIWKIRSHYATQLGRDSVRSNFPSFLFVYGVSKSGKTTLFEVLERLLGNNTQPMSYEVVSKHLYDYFHSDNLMPLLVDEIPENFMTSKAQYLGERLIKTVSNDIKGKHPVMIGASNSDRFSIPPQVQRRVRFIRVSNTFKQTEESQSCLIEVLNQIDSNLFRDFTWRMAQLITNDDNFYKPFDMLAAGREIFKEYYADCEMSIPDWFPHKPFDDYEERGKTYWRNAYKTNPSAFKEADEGKLIVNLDAIVANKQDRDFVTNLLPSECLGDKMANALQLKKNEFLNFIGEPRKGLKDKLIVFFKRDRY